MRAIAKHEFSGTILLKLLRNSHTLKFSLHDSTV